MLRSYGLNNFIITEPFAKDFEALIKQMSNFWIQLVHMEIYQSTIMKE